jgi:4,5-dihydroxyphthalate decarboxylase
MSRFHHGGFVVRPEAGIKAPKDLEGRKVGVRAYSVTTGVWTRGIFTNEYGLDSSKVTWVVDDEEHVTTLKLPENVVHAPEGKSLAGMMAAGELQAAFSGPAGIGRAGPPTGAWETGGQGTSEVYPELIADVAKVEADWFRRTGIYPIHGLVVVRSEVIWKHPWVARALYEAFATAKQPYIQHLRGTSGDAADDKKYRGLMPLVGDPLPYGFMANMPSIEAMLTYGLQQKLIPKRMSLDEAFADPEKA